MVRRTGRSDDFFQLFFEVTRVPSERLHWLVAISVIAWLTQRYVCDGRIGLNEEPTTERQSRAAVSQLATEKEGTNGQRSSEGAVEENISVSSASSIPSLIGLFRFD